MTKNRHHLVLKTSLVAVCALAPASSVWGYSSGSGTSDDPYIVTSSDTIMDEGSSYYLINASLAFGDSVDIYIGKSNTDNFLTISGSATTVSDRIGYIGEYSGSSGSVTVTGNGAAWNSQLIAVGDIGVGILNIEDGGSVSVPYSYIGNSSGGVGTATVTGSGSTWSATSLTVGYRSTGTLNVENGGQISVTKGYLGGMPYDTDITGVGTATVTGSGSKWTSTASLYVGYLGTGTLNIEDGGSVSNSSGYLGFNTGSSGTATVTGSGSTWISTSSLYVGYYGTGTLNIEDGASVSDASGGYLGFMEGSSGTVSVTGTGSEWINNNSCAQIGLYGTGALDISNGGSVVVGSIGAAIAQYSGSTGKLKVFGSGSSFSGYGELYVGCGGSGSMAIRYGGYVTGEWATIGFLEGSEGTAVVAGRGSLWANSSNILVGYASTGDYSGTGKLTITNDAMVTGNGIETNNGSIYLAAGNLAINGETAVVDLIAACGIYVYNGMEYVAASTANIAATYYDGTTNAWSSGDLYEAYGSLIDLDGYTVITGGVPYFGWADSSAYSDGWYDSSWYGWFYSGTTYGDWIWHTAHGWQFVYNYDDDGESNAIIAWDNATGTWWYTSEAAYPCMYNYTTGAWYYYTSGTVGSREFWDYTDNQFVYESAEF